MALDKSLRPVTTSEKIHTAEDIERVTQRMNAIIALVPPDACLEALRKTEESDLRDCGGSVLVPHKYQDIEVARERARMFDLPPEAVEEFAEFLQKMAGKKLSELAEADPPLVESRDEEVAAIATTLVTTWLQTLYQVRERGALDLSQPVRLTPDFFPEIRPVDSHHSFEGYVTWADILAHHLSHMLDPTEVETVYQAFAERVRQEIERTPAGFEVIQIDDTLLLICKDEQGYFLAPCK